MTNILDNPTPQYESIADWRRRSGMSTTAVYSALGEGHLKAKKLGRKTVIDVAAGLAWLASRPSWSPSVPVARRRGENG